MFWKQVPNSDAPQTIEDIAEGQERDNEDEKEEKEEPREEREYSKCLDSMEKQLSYHLTTRARGSTSNWSTLDQEGR